MTEQNKTFRRHFLKVVGAVIRASVLACMGLAFWGTRGPDVPFASVLAQSPQFVEITWQPEVTSITPTPAPTTPPRPAFEQYPEFIANYLSNTDPDKYLRFESHTQRLEMILREWGAITPERGKVEILSGLIGRGFVLVHVYRPPDSDRLMIFRVDQNQAQLILDSDKMERSGYQFQILSGHDKFKNHFRQCIAVTDRFRGAHTCYDRLHMFEWNGEAFVDLIGGRLEMPYPTYVIDGPQITAVSGHIGSAGAGPGRGYTEIWQWNGEVFTVTHKIVAPPHIRMGLVHDADAALERGDISDAISLYEQAIRDETLEAYFHYFSNETDGNTVIDAYSRFKLVVAHTLQGQIEQAKSSYEQLVAENLPDSLGYVYAELGQAFWETYTDTDDMRAACEATIAMAEAKPEAASQLNTGYQNRGYSAQDLCRLPESTK